MLLKTSEYVKGVVTKIVLQKVFPTFWASLPSSVKPEMFGNRFELGFSGDVFRPQHVTVRTDCQDIVRFGVTYERLPMSHGMAPRRPRERRQQQQAGSPKCSNWLLKNCVILRLPAGEAFYDRGAVPQVVVENTFSRFADTVKRRRQAQ